MHATILVHAPKVCYRYSWVMLLSDNPNFYLISIYTIPVPSSFLILFPPFPFLLTLFILPFHPLFHSLYPFLSSFSLYPFPLCIYPSSALISIITLYRALATLPLTLSLFFHPPYSFLPLSLSPVSTLFIPFHPSPSFYPNSAHISFLTLYCTLTSLPLILSPFSTLSIPPFPLYPLPFLLPVPIQTQLTYLSSPCTARWLSSHSLYPYLSTLYISSSHSLYPPPFPLNLSLSTSLPAPIQA